MKLSLSMNFFFWKYLRAVPFIYKTNGVGGERELLWGGRGRLEKNSSVEGPMIAINTSREDWSNPEKASPTGSSYK